MDKIKISFRGVRNESEFEVLVTFKVYEVRDEMTQNCI
jgi:hypothetical protein